MVLLAVGVALLPPLGILVQRHDDHVDIPTFFLGAALVLSIVIRSTAKLPFRSVTHWRRSLSLTNTAVALGCIPVPLILLVHPQALYIVSEHASVQRDGSGFSLPPEFQAAVFIVQVAVWAGLCEEFIYRGMLVSILRRYRGLQSSRFRDWVAVVVSAAIFAVGHLPAWGPGMSVALFGLGLGFGAAFVATGEAILALVIYHIGFDVLSLTFAYITYKF